MTKPLVIDLFCGLGGWADGFLAEGFDVIGFDTERHDYGTGGYPGQLVLQDVLTLHGSQFRNAAVIVASPPCQAYSYRAMPWQRAKALPPPSNELFEACFRIQQEAIDANCGACPCRGCFDGDHCRDCGSHNIPLVVENVKGAQPWVGRARWHYGSFYLWGDVPALMPSANHFKANPDGTNHGQGSWFAIADSKNRGTGRKVAMNFHEFEKTGKPGRSFQSAAVEGVKQAGLSGPAWFDGGAASHSSASVSRKAASAQIAKIPLPLSRHIAQVYRPVV